MGVLSEAKQQRMETLICLLQTSSSSFITLKEKHGRRVGMTR
jgi:hypothetical protein